MGPFKVGDRIFDRFEVRGLLGRGGHAFVYDCYNAYLNESVAIKVIPASLHAPQRGQQLFNRARGEAQMLYQLNHPNVVRVTDGGDFEGMAIMVMEKLEGMNLREYLNACGPLTVLEALTILVQIASALEAAHGMGVIHRDLKPENIFVLTERGGGAAGGLLIIKVLDFGIAKFLEGAYQTTQRDLIQGTAPYMSPEQAQAMGVTFASDIFQLVTLAYELLAGVCPCFVGTEDPTPNVILAIQISKIPTRLKELVPNISVELDQIVWRGLAKNAQQRQGSMRELRIALESELHRHRAELPPDERKLRVIRTRAPSAAPPAEPSAPVARRPTVIALEMDRTASGQRVGKSEHTAGMAPQSPPSAPASPSPQIRATRPQTPPSRSPTVRSDFSSAAVARAVDQPSAGNASLARRTLLRALLIGAAVSLPTGLVAFKLFVRDRLRAPERTAVAALATQPAPTTAPPPPHPSASATALAAPLTVAPAPEPVPPAIPARSVVRPPPTSSPSARKVTVAAAPAPHRDADGILDDPIFPIANDSPSPKVRSWVAPRAEVPDPPTPKSAPKPTAAAAPPAPKKIPKLIF